MKINDVCSRFNSGKSISPKEISETGRYPVYGGNGIRGYTEKYNFSGECAVIGRQGAYCGNVKFFSGKGYMTEHAVVAVGNENADTRFLAYKFGLMNLGRYAGQSAQPGLSVEMLANLPIDLPPLTTQRKIAAMLGALDDKIALNKKINATLEAMAKTLYDYWFVQFDFPDDNGKPYKTSGGKMIYNSELGRDIPIGWEVKHVADLTAVKTGKEDANFATINGKFAYFTCGQDILRCDDPAFEGHAVLLAGNGDFNVKHYTGKFNAYQRTYVLIPNDEKYYALLYIATKNAINRFIKNSAGSIVKFITIGDVNGITLLAPQNDSLLKMLNALIYKKEQLQSESRRLAELRDWLLPMLMNGQVDFKRGEN